MTDNKNSGFEAFGKKVPANRLTNAYKFVKEVLIDVSSEAAFTLVGRAASSIENDTPYDILGATVDPCFDILDLTGRYRLVAHLTTG